MSNRKKKTMTVSDTDAQEAQEQDPLAAAIARVLDLADCSDVEPGWHDKMEAALSTIYDQGWADAERMLSSNMHWRLKDAHNRGKAEGSDTTHAQFVRILTDMVTGVAVE